MEYFWYSYKQKKHVDQCRREEGAKSVKAVVKTPNGWVEFTERGITDKPKSLEIWSDMTLVYSSCDPKTSYV